MMICGFVGKTDVIQNGGYLRYGDNFWSIIKEQEPLPLPIMEVISSKMADRSGSSSWSMSKLKTFPFTTDMD